MSDFDPEALALKHNLQTVYHGSVGGEVVEHESIYGPILDALTEAHALGILDGLRQAADPDALQELQGRIENAGRAGYVHTLALCDEVFRTRESMVQHPLRDTHVNDVPVISAGLSLQFYTAGIAEGLRRAADLVGSYTSSPRWPTAVHMVTQLILAELRKGKPDAQDKRDE